MTRSALFTDLYELTMAQGFWKNGMNKPAVFDMFFRKQPFSGGFSILAGIEPLLETIEGFSFSGEDLDWLSARGIFEDDFLSWLGGFRFSGDIYAMEEGSVVFPNEPLLRVHASLIEAALIEGLVLNTVNFQSLVATKAARVCLASKGGTVMEFGMRRAQGFDGAMSASRAAYIGGVSGTSNVLAGKELGIPVMGTMAHSWIMSFKDEQAAFDAYARQYPSSSIFLIDTYNTLESGLPAAIEAGKKLAALGKNFGVRLDSGDIQYLSAKVRDGLDKAGLNKATIAVSNELTEEIIESLVLNGAPIDVWGVGTHLVTGGRESSFTGVYKLAAAVPAADTTAASGVKTARGGLEPVMKLSDNPEKASNPGVKNVWRLFDEDGTFKADVLALEDESIPLGEKCRYFHPANDLQSFACSASRAESLLTRKMAGGRRTAPVLSATESLALARNRAQDGLATLDKTYKRILNPHVYKVSLTEKLKNLKLELMGKYSS